MHIYKQNYNSFFEPELDIIEINREKEKKSLVTTQFIERAVKVHGNSFDYSKTNYINMSTKIIIICRKHNVEFTQTPNNHLHGPIACSLCNKNIRPRIIRKKPIKMINKKINIVSVGEKLIEYWLNKNSIKYEKQKTYNGCKNRKKLRYDFYLPNKNILIEYDGRQHFEPVKSFGGDIGFENQKINDKIKTEYAKDNGIKLLRIPYTERKNLSNLLEKKIM